MNEKLELEKERGSAMSCPSRMTETLSQEFYTALIFKLSIHQNPL